MTKDHRPAAQVLRELMRESMRRRRKQLGLSRLAFARRFGLAVAAVRDWEHGLRRPDPTARVLLMVIGRNPDVVAKAVAETRAA